MWYWSIFDKTGYEVSSSFEDSDETKAQKVKDMKSIVDDYIAHPENYTNSDTDEDWKAITCG